MFTQLGEKVKAMFQIGVVIATYNGEKYIEQQLTSIIQQTQMPDYIVVSDGGSQDGTVSICHRILSRADLEFRILTSNERVEVSKNFERGFKECPAEYIFFADQDDVWNNNKIEIVLKHMEDRKAIMGFTNASIVDDDLVDRGLDLWSRVGYHQETSVKEYKKSDNVLFKELLQHNIVTGMCMCVHSSIKEYALPFSNKTIHDVWMSLIAVNVGTVIGIEQKCVLYRQHENNVIGTNKTLKRTLKHGAHYYESIKNRVELMNDLTTRLGDVLSDENRITLNKYVEYLKYRLCYIKREGYLLQFLKNIDRYKEYDFCYKQILVRDVLCRMFFGHTTKQGRGQ